MKTKLLRKLRRQAENKIYVCRRADGSYMLHDEYFIWWCGSKSDAIDSCKRFRRCKILEKIDRLRPPKRIF